MCGISAVVGEMASSEARALVGAMHAPIRHRGPDGEGFLLVDDAMQATRTEAVEALPADGRARVAFAFRRLKIVDLTEAAAQPMRTARGTSWLVFNGEIYNYRELRRELAALGHQFRSDGDAEVALCAYEEWGTDCFRRFDGMWAIVIADLANRRLIASRDRLGIKPLFWHRDGGRLLLASEIKQILAAGVRPAPNLPLVLRYLHGNRLPVFDETFFRDIRMVPAATWFAIDLDAAPPHVPDFVPYWDLSRIVAGRLSEGEYSSAQAELSSLLEATVDSHSHADVATGCLLSGGLDSGVLAAMMARKAAAGERLRTFSFGFRESAPLFCEMPYVDAIAAREPRIQNFETTFDSRWVADHTADAIRALEEPPLALAAVAQYRVFQLCREHDTTVVLDGEGSDEIFAGYAPYHRFLLTDRIRQGRFREAAGELRAMSRRYETSMPGMLVSFVAPGIVRRIRKPRYQWLDGHELRAGRSPLDVVTDRSADPSLVNRHLYDAVRWGNMKIVLGYTDRNAMAHSVEARVPYMDHRVVELAFSMPDSYKAGRGDRKRILRDIGRELLPPVVTERKDRMGFGTPDAQFWRDGLWKRGVDAIRDAGIASLPYIRRSELDRYLDDFHRGRHQDLRSIWRLYAFAEWRSTFGVTDG